MFFPLFMNFTWNNQDTSQQTTTQKAAKIENVWTKTRLGKKKKTIWVERKNGWKDIERKEVKRRNTSFGWKKLGRLHVNGLLMAYWSPLFWVLTQDFTFHKKIGSGNRDDMFKHWNQKPHFGGVTSEDPQNNQKPLGGLVFQRNDLATRRALTATIHPKRRAGGIAGRLCRPLPRHSDECTWTHPES